MGERQQLIQGFLQVTGDVWESLFPQLPHVPDLIPYRRSSPTEQNASGQGQSHYDRNDHPELFGVPAPPWNCLRPPRQVLCNGGRVWQKVTGKPGEATADGYGWPVSNLAQLKTIGKIPDSGGRDGQQGKRIGPGPDRDLRQIEQSCHGEDLIEQLAGHRNIFHLIDIHSPVRLHVAHCGRRALFIVKHGRKNNLCYVKQ